MLIYNIRYGTGANQPRMPWSGLLRRTTDQLEKISAFIHSVDPDVIGLIEVDKGSYRSRHQSQPEIIANRLGHYHTYKSKYSVNSIAKYLPLYKNQGNAFLSRDGMVEERFHYFEKGVKRLVIELELENVTIFLVHLALRFFTRHQQLSELYDLVNQTHKPVIVAGDFNARWGEKEIGMFMAASGLINANSRQAPSFPSWNPKRHLDFILHSSGIELLEFRMPYVMLSDHLPLIADFKVKDGTLKS